MTRPERKVAMLNEKAEEAPARDVREKDNRKPGSARKLPQNFDGGNAPAPCLIPPELPQRPAVGVSDTFRRYPYIGGPPGAEGAIGDVSRTVVRRSTYYRAPRSRRDYCDHSMNCPESPADVLNRCCPCTPNDTRRAQGSAWVTAGPSLPGDIE